MSRYENACDFLQKADWEGGVADMVFGYGLDADDVPPAVAAKLEPLKAAWAEFTDAIDEWHVESREEGHQCSEEDW